MKDLSRINKKNSISLSVLKTENKGLSYLGVGSIIARRDDIILVTEVHNLDKISVNDKGDIEYNDAYCVGLTFSNIEDLKQNKPKYESKPYRLEWHYWGDVFSDIKEFEKYIEKLNNIDFEDLSEEDNTVSDSTEIANISSKDVLETQLMLAQNAQRNYDLLVSAQNYKMRVMKEQMEVGLRLLRDKCEIFKVQVDKIQKLIWTVELYLGVNEQVVQLAEGATSNDVINYFQKVLYMDVEYGKPGDESIDFTNIEQFDEWLVKDNNYKMFTTERCIRVFRVRKEDKYYDNNVFINRMMNKDNHLTYFLIRNGENLYRVYADIIVNKLFPDQDEFIQVQTDYRRSQEQMEQHFEQYKRQIITLQGLTVRTHIFDPIPNDFDLLNPEIHDSGLVKFIYSKMELSPDNRKSFAEWKKEINSKVSVGSRIIWISHDNDLDWNRVSGRYFSWGGDYKNSWTAPRPPFKGEIFHLEDDKNENNYKYDFSGKIIHRSNSRDSYNRYNEDDPKQLKATWYFSENDEWINYDACTLEDIRYYLNSRHEREKYMSVFPILFQIESQLIIDKKFEDAFKEMIHGYLLSLGKDVDSSKIDNAISWWKLKNKWKRSLQSDDCDHEAKAFRMIVNKLK